MERFDEADSFWRTVLRDSPDDIDAGLGLAVTSAYRHDWDTARACFYRAYEVNPSPETLLMLTRFHLLMGSLDEAQRLHRQILMAQDSNACARFAPGSLAGQSILLRLDSFRRLGAVFRIETGPALISPSARELCSLLRTSPGVDQTVELFETPPATDLNPRIQQRVWIPDLGNWLRAGALFAHPAVGREIAAIREAANSSESALRGAAVRATPELK